MPGPLSPSLLELLSPRSVAIIGASSDATKFSGRVLPYLTKHGFTGSVYPINARRKEVMGIPCFADLSSAPDPVECVVCSIAAADVEAVLVACERKRGVRLLIVTSAGFAERGDQEGRRLQNQLTEFARRTGIRVIGPNCIGFFNLVDSVAVAPAAVLEWPDLRPGRIGLVSQSGGLAFGTILLGAHEKGIGFSRIVTTGNEADTEIAEWADALVDDGCTDAIALTIEGLRDGPAFQAFLERAQRAGKPVVILKSGRTSLGETMAMSHTGAIAGSQAVFEAVCAQHGVTLVDDLDELYEISAMFAKLRTSGKLKLGAEMTAHDRRNGCTALSISGGHIGLFADLASRHDVEFPTLAMATQERLAQELAKSGPILNPVDLTGGTVSDPGLWGRCLTALLEDPGVQIAVPILTVSRNYDSVCDDLIRISLMQDKTVIVIWVGGSFDGAGKALVRASPLPVFETQRVAARAVSALGAYWHVAASSIESKVIRSDSARANHAETVLAVRTELLRLAAGHTMLGEFESKQILAKIGFPKTREIFATSTEGALCAAHDIGFPVVLKGAHPDVAHKTEAGLVKLNLGTPEQLVAAFEEIQSNMKQHAANHRAAGVLVQEMLSSGVELILGVKRDPVFGPAVMFGLGGIFVEIFNDVALRPAPLTHEAARSMIEELAGVDLLKGARGRRPADLDGIASLIVALGDLAASNADIIREIDINPLIIIDRADDRLRVVDALIVFDDKTRGVPL